MVTEPTEMYLKTIWNLTQQKQHAKTTEIASILKLVPSSVTEMLQRLQKEKYIILEDYKGGILTKKGKAIALRILNRERLLKKFLHDVLKIPEQVVREQACKLEHYISDETETALCKFLGYPKECPMDHEPILRCASCPHKCV